MTSQYQRLSTSQQTRATSYLGRQLDFIW